MARYIGPVCKLCRREGEKLFLKGERCFTPKCSFDKRSFAPGQHGRTGQFSRGRESDFARQLRAKQKARRVYGVLERQFRRYYGKALRSTGLTGLILLQFLETRLDNVVYRLGYAQSRSQARMLVSHGHFYVNGRRTDVPSFLVSPGDQITVRPGSLQGSFFKELGDRAGNTNVPLWLERNLNTLSGSMVRKPERSEIDGNLNEQLIVEYYSR